MRLYQITDLFTGKSRYIPATSPKVALREYIRWDSSMSKEMEIVIHISIGDLGVHLEWVKVEWKEGSYREIRNLAGGTWSFTHYPPGMEILDRRWVPKGEQAPGEWMLRKEISEIIARKRRAWDAQMDLKKQEMREKWEKDRKVREESLNPQGSR